MLHFKSDQCSRSSKFFFWTNFREKNLECEFFFQMCKSAFRNFQMKTNILAKKRKKSSKLDSNKKCIRSFAVLVLTAAMK